MSDPSDSAPARKLGPRDTALTAAQALTGSRIRERRIMAGIKQADLAAAAGISASYLNLIEHNKRKIGGKLLLAIAAALEVEPQTLAQGAEAALIAALREAADSAGLQGPDLARADEFAGRFPGWAEVLVQTRRRVAALKETVEALNDRLGHDPHLAAAMHELLSTAAAVRSTASILAETETLQPEWRKRFHANIHEDATRLSGSAQELVAYLDAPETAPGAAASPQEEVEQFLAANDFTFPALEAARDPAQVIADLIAREDRLTTRAARHFARRSLMRIARDAEALDLVRLREAVAEEGADPAALVARLHLPAALVLRRLAALPELGAGLVVCDRAGSVLFRKSVAGFTVPRHGACCPLWPLFAALAQPADTILRERIAQAGRAQAHFDVFAASEAARMPPRYNRAPALRAVMLLLPVPEGRAEAHPVGATCRVCPQQGCLARREPSIFDGQV